MPTIIHIVLFEFKRTTEPEVIQDICRRFLALKDTCIHPTTHEPYIQSFVGGRDNSPEGFQGGFTHGFVLEFASAEDRDYYVASDTAHMSFGKTWLTGVVERDVRVLDFVPGVF